MNAEQQCEHRHDDERRQAAALDGLHDELVAVIDRPEKQQKVEPVTCGKDERAAADLARQLAERDDRSRERDGTDEHADVGLDVMDRQFDARVVREAPRVHEVRESDRDGSEADEAVQDRDEFRHLRHLHTAREYEPYSAADEQRDDELVEICRYVVTRNGREQGDRHADDAVPVTSACCFLV